MRLVSQDKLVSVPYEFVTLGISTGPYYSISECRIEARSLTDTTILATMGRYKDKETCRKIMERCEVACITGDPCFFFPKEESENAAVK